MEILILLFIGIASVYLKKKIQNLAKKEDLTELTNIVEEVKQKYRSENEGLKAQLDLLNNRKIEVFTEEKDAIIQFYSKVNEWIWDKTYIYLTDFNRGNINELNEKILGIKTCYNEVNILFSKVQLLVENKELIDAGHNLISQTLKMHQFVEGKCGMLKFALEEEKISTDYILSKDVDFIKLPKEIQEAVFERARDNEKSKKDILDGYLDKYLELFKIAIPLNHKFREVAKRHLQN